MRISLLTLLVVLGISTSNVSHAQTTLGTCTFHPNPSAGVFQGQATIEATPAEAGDIVSAYDESGNCAGAVEVIINSGSAFINLPIYGDDATTDGIDEGMDGGEVFELRITDVSSGAVWSYPNTFDQWSNENGGVIPSYNDPFTVYDFSVTLPVELVSLAATVEGQDVRLEWSTASEENNAGFSVEYRAAASGAFEPVGYVEGNGTTTEPHQYRFIVSNLDFGPATFRLKQVDFDGAFSYSDEVEVVVELPERLLLAPVYPNPIAGRATVEFATAKPERVRLTLYNALGKQVRVVFDDLVEANRTHRVGLRVEDLPSGLYILQLEAPGGRLSQKVTLVR